MTCLVNSRYCRTSNFAWQLMPCYKNKKELQQTVLLNSRLWLLAYLANSGLRCLCIWVSLLVLVPLKFPSPCSKFSLSPGCHGYLPLIRQDSGTQSWEARKTEKAKHEITKRERLHLSTSLTLSNGSIAYKSEILATNNVLSLKFTRPIASEEGLQSTNDDRVFDKLQ